MSDFLMLVLVIDANAQVLLGMTKPECRMTKQIRITNDELSVPSHEGQGGSASPQDDAKITGLHRVEDSAIHL